MLRRPLQPKIARMTWAGLVWKNLMRRPARTILTAFGVSIGVGLIVALLSITAGVRSTAKDLIHVGRSDFGLFQDGISDLTRSLLPESLADRVASVQGVAETAKVFVFVTTVNGQESSLVFGLDPDELAIKRLVIVEGRSSRGRSEAIVGDSFARINNVGVGGTLAIGKRVFPVVGLYHSGNRFEDIGATLPLQVVQSLAARPGEVTTVGVVVSHGERPDVVAKRLERQFPNLTAVTEPGKAVKIDTSSRLIINVGWIMSLVALIVGGVGVTNTMAMSVFERTREIGVLRAVGWRRWRIASLIVSEAVGICLIALALGIGLGVAGAEAFTRRATVSALITPNFTAAVWIWGLVFALGVALIGAVYPVLRAVQLTPIQALRHE